MPFKWAERLKWGRKIARGGNIWYLLGFCNVYSEFVTVQKNRRQEQTLVKVTQSRPNAVHTYCYRHVFMLFPTVPLWPCVCAPFINLFHSKPRFAPSELIFSFKCIRSWWRRRSAKKDVFMCRCLTIRRNYFRFSAKFLQRSKTIQ